MILVDTSVWIDHLHRPDRQLIEFLEGDQVGRHSHVVEELALGSIKHRNTFLARLARLWRFPVVGHDELTAMVEVRKLWGRGLSAVDAHVLGSVMITQGAALWTHDKRLAAVASELNVPCVTEGR